jgi:hypothetical protein
MRHLHTTIAASIALAVGTAACDRDLATRELPTEAAVEARGPAGPPDGPFHFSGAVFDIAATPNGSILVAVTEIDPDFNFVGNTIKEFGQRGIADVTDVPVAPGSPVNGLAPIGQRNFFATSGGQDLAVGAGLWRVSQGNARLVADIEAFTLGDWPRGAPGPHPAWKDFRCEALGVFSAGPQTNPYHVTALSGSEVLIGDAANNGVLSARTDGRIEVVAFMDPPLDPATGERMVLGEVEGVTCYVEPVPTSVAIGPDGAYYVGELTGTTAENFVGEPSPTGLARVWRIEPGARDVVCPSAQCREAISGLTTVIDLEFGPDGRLYVVEFDQHGFLASFGAFAPGGGMLKSCDVGTGQCQVVEDGLLFPGAITFDKWENLWLVDNVFAPTVRRVDLP